MRGVNSSCIGKTSFFCSRTAWRVAVCVGLAEEERCVSAY